MNVMRCFFIFLALSALVACGSNSFRAEVHPEQAAVVACITMAERERASVLPHLHYSLDVRSVDRKRGTVELSFYFIEEYGDTLLWVEGMERVPLALIDTSLCRRWFGYDSRDDAAYIHF